ncbi:MAG: biotin/lipoate--protein ligase family protein [Salaquimonas sp.]
MELEDPDFPPLISGNSVSAGENPADVAFEMARAGKAEAGDLFWSRDTHAASLAIILEPESKAEDALCMAPLAMVVVSDSIGAIGPPNLPITFDWPKTILANGAVVGGVEIRFPEQTKSADVPSFMVMSLHLNISWRTGAESSQTSSDFEPGKSLMRTVLHEEGAGDLDRSIIIGSWARHFTAWIDTWEQDGFKSVHENWLFRADKRNEMMTVETQSGLEQGVLIGMDEKGGLLLKQNGVTKLISLRDVWFEPGDKPSAEKVLQ